MKLQHIKCNLKQCLCQEEGVGCSANLPNMIEFLVPNSIKCTYYSDDFKTSCEEYKRRGGTIGVLARLNGKKPKKTLEEITDIKKSKRKPRADKGQKREKAEGGKKRGRPKKENSLSEIM